MKKNRIVIVGAGSTHTPGIIQSLVDKREEFPLSKLTLYDIDEYRVNAVYSIMKQHLTKYYPDLEVTVTCDIETAYRNQDFVFAQIRQGNLEMRAMDEKIPLKYGIIGQETCGPGGSISYGIRSIPAIFEIVENTKKYSPDAWILNYSNPAAVVAEATRRKYSNEKIINICDMPVAILVSYAKMLGLKSWEELTPTYFGLNHFGWFTHLYDKDGNDLLDEVRDIILTSGMQPCTDAHHNDKDWSKTWKQYNQLVKDFPEYLPSTYLQYYLYSKEMYEKTDPNNTRAEMVINGREKTMLEHYKKYLENPEEFQTPLESFTVFGEFIIDVATSLAYNQGKRYLVIVENNGAIPNLPSDAMVEIPAYIYSWGVEPVSIKPISSFYKGLIENQLASEKLTVDAYFENSYQKALEAIAINKTLNSSHIARNILDDFIIGNNDYWPKLK